MASRKICKEPIKSFYWSKVLESEVTNPVCTLPYGFLRWTGKQFSTEPAGSLRTPPTKMRICPRTPDRDDPHLTPRLLFVRIVPYGTLLSTHTVCRYDSYCPLLPPIRSTQKSKAKLGGCWWHWLSANQNKKARCTELNFGSSQKCWIQ